MYDYVYDEMLMSSKAYKWYENILCHMVCHTESCPETSSAQGSE